jgi:hypothetical protein
MKNSPHALPDGGRLLVHARWQAGCVSHLSTRLMRPLLTKILIGKTAAEAMRYIPLLYSLCRVAQGELAATVLALAAGHVPPPMDTRRLWEEMLHERFWRLCLDWPRLLGHPPATVESLRLAFANWRRARGDTTGFDRETRALLSALRPLAADDFFTVLLQQAEAHWQAWRQAMAFPVYAARIVTNTSFRRAHGVLLTARGWLLHEASLAQDDRILAYRIHAPTDRYMASRDIVTPLASCRIPPAMPPGMARARLTEAFMACLRKDHFPGRHTDDPATAPLPFSIVEEALSHAILRLDPCVPYEILWEGTDQPPARQDEQGQRHA